MMALSEDTARQLARILGPGIESVTIKRAEEVAGTSPLAGKTLERFVAKVALDADHGCWLWTGATQTKGYGSFGFDGRTYLVHRLAWLHLRGAIPAELTVDHMCSNIRCVNALQHLRIVSRGENTAHRGRAFRDYAGVDRESLPLLDPAAAFLRGEQVAA